MVHLSESRITRIWGLHGLPRTYCVLRTTYVAQSAFILLIRRIFILRFYFFLTLF